MVYFGPSRGCETCKRRRKKCDETRPSCLRCTTAQRTCGGYEDAASRKFRQYDGQFEGPLPLTSTSTARKCSLPVRVSGPNTNTLPEDAQPREVSDEKVEDFALRAFFYDYCIISTNNSISRGYLDGLELMLNRLGWQSDAAKACKAVAFASHGIKLCRPGLTRKAELFYNDLLASLAKAIVDPVFINNMESLTIVTLLGLYEMITASDAYADNLNAHARGVAAILQVDIPLDLFGAVRLIQSGHPLVSNGIVQKCGMFPAPYSNNSSQSLDNLLLAFGPIWRKADAFFGYALNHPLTQSDDLNQLKNEAIALDQAFAKWQEAQVKDFNPWTVGHVSQVQAGSRPGVGYWPGRIDMYFDLYVAGVWNTSRTARVLLINMILRLSRHLNANENNTRKQQDALRLVEDIISSIPFHLAEDLSAFLHRLQGAEVGKAEMGKESAATTLIPGRPVGGLLLMHSIYVASKLSIVPQQMREYMDDCLEWIAKYMGIGQASLFAKAPDNFEEIFADSCTVVWAGMLI